MEEKERNYSKGEKILLNIILTILVIGTGSFMLYKLGYINFNKDADGLDNNETNTSVNTDNNERSYEDLPAENTDNWEISEEAKKYIKLEDVSLTSDVTTKKVKLENLDESLTSQFYKDQQEVIDNIHIYTDEHTKGGAGYKVKAFVNNNILSVAYLLEEDNAVGTCGTKMAVTNIDLANKKVITEEELLAKVGASYEKLVEDYYETEKIRWKKYNDENEHELDYYGLTYKDFSSNKEKYVNEALEKFPNIIYTYIEDGKIKYDYYSIHTGTLFHQVGKGGCFFWETKTLGDYK